MYRDKYCIVLLVLAAAFSCSRTVPHDEIILPATPPLSRDVIGYGVINNNYTHILDKQGEDGKSLGFLRRGSIVEIHERRPLISGEKVENWALIKGDYSGWLKEDELRIYSSMAQAQTAAANLQ